ncbi:MAG: hypothetical protein EZS28_019051 [Streblomastix strix]|uniref:Uncharacterized protein n=1 Tax=Streblomastix strix TaxID=222440 RepID=A0A5J4VSM9_9EUKA|nr:MAG: hypothetical protein EZS28_019051 [Streblomastix strix]
MELAEVLRSAEGRAQTDEDRSLELARLKKQNKRLDERFRMVFGIFASLLGGLFLAMGVREAWARHSGFLHSSYEGGFAWAAHCLAAASLGAAAAMIQTDVLRPRTVHHLRHGSLYGGAVVALFWILSFLAKRAEFFVKFIWVWIGPLAMHFVVMYASWELRTVESQVDEYEKDVAPSSV